MINFKHFSKNDWMGFEGAESFVPGKIEPYIATLGDDNDGDDDNSALIIILDGVGIHFHYTNNAWEDEYGFSMGAKADAAEYTILMSWLMAGIATLTLRGIVDHLEDTYHFLSMPA